MTSTSGAPGTGQMIVGGASGGCGRSLFLRVVWGGASSYWWFMGGASSGCGWSLFLLVVVGGASGGCWSFNLQLQLSEVAPPGFSLLRPPVVCLHGYLEAPGMWCHQGMCTIINQPTLAHTHTHTLNHTHTYMNTHTLRCPEFTVLQLICDCE